MVCVCKNTMERLAQALQSQAGQAQANQSQANQSQPGQSQPGQAQAGQAQAGQSPADAEAARALQSLAGWMGRHGLPARPWQPDPAWLELELPAPPFSPAAMATLSAFAQLRASAEALGIDLLDPAQAKAFTRMVATLHQRLASLDPLPDDAAAAAEWAQLAARQNAAQQVRDALAQGVLPAPPPGPPLSVWRPFLSRLRPLLPLVAAVQQLRLPDPEAMAEQLAQMLRNLLRIPVPPPLTLAAQVQMTLLLSRLSAIAALRQALGGDPLAQGIAAVRRQVADQVAAVTQEVQEATGQSPAQLVSRLTSPQARPPEYCPTLMAPPAVVQAARALTLPPLPWQVPDVAEVALLRVGQPAVAFIAQMKAVLGDALATTPCGQGCDAASLLRAATAATVAA